MPLPRLPRSSVLPSCLSPCLSSILTSCVVVLAGLSSVPQAADAAAPLRTEAERSGFQRTGRYEEVGRLCRAFQQR